MSLSLRNQADQFHLLEKISVSYFPDILIIQSSENKIAPTKKRKWASTAVSTQARSRSNQSTFFPQTLPIESFFSSCFLKHNIHFWQIIRLNSYLWPRNKKKRKLRKKELKSININTERVPIYVYILIYTHGTKWKQPRVWAACCVDKGWCIWQNNFFPWFNMFGLLWVINTFLMQVCLSF